MFRRCVSVLVIAGLFASQLAAIPHAHGGFSAADQQHHDATPHFHCHWLCHGDYDHDHAHGDHSHAPVDQPKKNGSKPGEKPDGQPFPDGLGGSDYDASAIFVPVHAGAPSTTIQKESAESVWLATLVPMVDWLGASPPGLCSTAPWHPPDEVLDASGTYLTLRNLRI